MVKYQKYFNKLLFLHAIFVSHIISFLYFILINYKPQELMKIIIINKYFILTGNILSNIIETFILYEFKLNKNVFMCG